jgi:hypothetical protein
MAGFMSEPYDISVVEDFGTEVTSMELLKRLASLK